MQFCIPRSKHAQDFWKKVTGNNFRDEILVQQFTVSCPDTQKRQMLQVLERFTAGQQLTIDLFNWMNQCLPNFWEGGKPLDKAHSIVTQAWFVPDANTASALLSGASANTFVVVPSCACSSYDTPFELRVCCGGSSTSCFPIRRFYDAATRKTFYRCAKASGLQYSGILQLVQDIAERFHLRPADVSATSLLYED